MPARNRRRTNNPNTQRHSFNKKWVFLAALILIIIAVLRFILSSGIQVNTFSVVFSQPKGDAIVNVYNFERDTITAIYIPGDTGVTAGFGLGEWRVKSLRKLDDQERLGGELLRMSIAKTLHLPVDAWSDGSLPSANPATISSFLSSSSSLTLKEKLQLVLFAIQTPSVNIDNIRLEETQYLKETKLSDGERGYELTGTLPPRIATAFSTMTNEGLLKVGVYDRTGGRTRTLSDVTEVVHILGGDWAIIEQPKEDTDCVVRGNNEMAQRIRQTFLCEQTMEPVEGNFSVEMVIGEAFANRF